MMGLVNIYQPIPNARLTNQKLADEQFCLCEMNLWLKITRGQSTVKLTVLGATGSHCILTTHLIFATNMFQYYSRQHTHTHR